MSKNDWTIHVKFTKEEYDKIRKLADKEDRTMPNLIHKALRDKKII